VGVRSEDTTFLKIINNNKKRFQKGLGFMRVGFIEQIKKMDQDMRKRT